MNPISRESYFGWTKSNSHHLRNPGMKIPLYTPTDWLKHGCKVVRDGFRSSKVGTWGWGPRHVEMSCAGVPCLAPRATSA